jgi:solute:Na+ symporter, SSS family
LKTSELLWILLLGYGVLMWVLSPRALGVEQFFRGRDRRGREVGPAFLLASVVISWIFAKSLTNAANLGFQLGLVGAVAYAGWYLSIPVAGGVIYWIRTRHQARSLPEFLTSRYGTGAALAFMLVVLVRLMNEVWSNTAVVAGYFGTPGSAAYYAAAAAFAGITLLYSLRGGLRSSIVTDVVQFALGAFFLLFVLVLVVPRSGPRPLVTSGDWTLRGGVDLLLVALIQSLSYPFHDPVLTDRGFITKPRTMLRVYVFSGAIAGAFIVLFGLVGVSGRVQALAPGDDAPIQVARAFGGTMLAVMSLLMMLSAGSTLDSTLSSISKAAAIDFGAIGRSRARGGLGAGTAAWASTRDPLTLGRWAMVIAVILGSLPLVTGIAILKATTISGTMVLGLAPPLLLFSWPAAGRWAFHLAFWPGIVLGALYAVNAVPAAWSLGDGPYASLLGVNVYGTVVVVLGFVVGAMFDRRSGRTPPPAYGRGLKSVSS